MSVEGRGWRERMGMNFDLQMVKGNKFKQKEGDKKLVKLDGVKKPEVVSVCGPIGLGGNSVNS